MCGIQLVTHNKLITLPATTFGQFFRNGFIFIFFVFIKFSKALLFYNIVDSLRSYFWMYQFSLYIYYWYLTILLWNAIYLRNKMNQFITKLIKLHRVEIWNCINTKSLYNLFINLSHFHRYKIHHVKEPDIIFCYSIFASGLY